MRSKRQEVFKYFKEEAELALSLRRHKISVDVACGDILHLRSKGYSGLLYMKPIGMWNEYNIHVYKQFYMKSPKESFAQVEAVADITAKVISLIVTGLDNLDITELNIFPEVITYNPSRKIESNIFSTLVFSCPYQSLDYVKLLQRYKKWDEYVSKLTENSKIDRKIERVLDWSKDGVGGTALDKGCTEPLIFNVDIERDREEQKFRESNV